MEDIQDIEIALYGVQGLYGGRNIWITKDSNITVQKVDVSGTRNEGLVEELYQWQLSKEQLNELSNSIKKADIKNLKIPKRLGVPDEAYNLLYVRDAQGNTSTHFKWDDDLCFGFDLVYDLLIHIASDVQNHQAYSTGKYNNACPDIANNFPSFDELMFLADQG